MKKMLPAFLIMLITLVMLNACSNTKEAAMQRKEALNSSKTTADECFVQMMDGTKKSYASLQLVTGIYKVPHLLADGKIKIYPGEIIAYQNKKHFAVAANGFSYGGHKSNIGVETLPGFAVRIASGRLNVYVKKYKAGNQLADEYFLQEGEGQILAYSPEIMDALIKNSPEALDFFNNNRKHIRLTKQLKETAFIFNGAYFDKDKQADNNAVAFSGKRKTKKY